jgi:hypothetical protein
MGIGILAKMAFDPARDQGVRLINADHLFAPSTTRIALRRNTYLRRYLIDFIELFSKSAGLRILQLSGFRILPQDIDIACVFSESGIQIDFPDSGFRTLSGFCGGVNWVPKSMV